MKDCKKCKHLIMFDYKNRSYSCESGECEFDPEEQEPTTKNDKVDCEHTDCNNCVNHKYCDYEPTTKNDLGVDREDAVERLNALKQLIGYDKDSEIVKATQKSLDMAIKALDQEPMVEIDLYSVIKQKYIEREVLDKIRAEIEQLSTTICTETRRIYIDADDFKENVLAIFDKYKAESEEE